MQMFLEVLLRKVYSLKSLLKGGLLKVLLIERAADITDT